MEFEAHLSLHMQVMLTTWFIVMLGYTSDPSTSAINRKVIQALNIVLAAIVIVLNFHPKFH